MMFVFLDTVGLLALWDEDDQWHRAAAGAFEQVVRSEAGLITTEQVLLECGNAAARRPYRASVPDLRSELAASGQLIVPTAGDVASAWETYGRAGANQPGIVDLISFEVMRRMGINRVFSNDRHFRAAGFETLF